MYILIMKKQVYLTVIGIGAVLAIIGFIPGGMSGIWGVLIAGIAGLLYYFNRKTEAKVAERLKSEEENLKPQASKKPAGAKPSEGQEEPASPEEPASAEGEEPEETPEE